ncbi:hypothetical protein CJ177_12545 [Rhodococcus sp. ACPA1]|nr:hypothetical protein CJ177_12545 [Rhodococcus sp. ACPA1]
MNGEVHPWSTSSRVGIEQIVLACLGLLGGGAPDAAARAASLSTSRPRRKSLLHNTLAFVIMRLPN